jgi:predicted GIY-YIG superfamily endonuclease
MYHVYILRCKDSSLYCGYTNDLVRRISLHNRGKGSKYTRSRLPVKLVYSEELSSISLALRRELEIKQLSKSAKELIVLGSKV